jgi:hypothetical protein
MNQDLILLLGEKYKIKQEKQKITLEQLARKRVVIKG